MTGALALAVIQGDRALQASASPTSVSGSYNGASGAAQNIATGNTIATGTGGRTPYTYAWAQVGTSADVWTISAPTSATTKFTATAIGPGSDAYATFRVTITDAVGMTAGAPVSAEANNRSTA